MKSLKEKQVTEIVVKNTKFSFTDLDMFFKNKKPGLYKITYIYNNVSWETTLYWNGYDYFDKGQ